MLEFGEFRLLTDPTFDPAGGDYTTGPVTLHKLRGPALGITELGPVDYVLLSHDHHFDNLDHAGRALLSSAKKVFTTEEGAQRLGDNSVGLTDWQSAYVPSPEGQMLRVTASPARHGPKGLNRGAVNGFVLSLEDAPEQTVYVSGDTVWYEGVAEVGRRFNPRVAILHLGAARVPAVGPFHLTMTAQEAVEAARSLAQAVIVPVHFEDWAHFPEGSADIQRAFAGAHMEDRLRWPERGRTVQIDLQPPLAKTA